MDDNKNARDAFGADSGNASSAFGSGTPQGPTPPPAPPVPVRPTTQLPMQAFSDLGQAQQPLTQPDASQTATASSDAVIAMALALIGLFICPIVASVPALVFARRAKQSAAANPYGSSGGGVAQIATVIAWFTIIGWLLFFALWVVIVATGFSLV